jgi:hypothetical protein
MVEFVEAAHSDISVIHRGVLFLMAFWSGPSVVGFKNVCRVFCQAELPSDFVFRVLDLDGANESLLQALSLQSVRIGGNGEAYWFRHGGIFAATSVATATDEHIQQLLTEISRP